MRRRVIGLQQACALVHLWLHLQELPGRAEQEAACQQPWFERKHSLPPARVRFACQLKCCLPLAEGRLQLMLLLPWMGALQAQCRLTLTNRRAQPASAGVQALHHCK